MQKNKGCFYEKCVMCVKIFGRENGMSPVGGILFQGFVFPFNEILVILHPNNNNQ